MDTMRWSEQLSLPQDGGPGAPTIKNHSVTHFKGNLYCFGGYDGRRNHMTLLMYSIQERRWFRPHHVGGGGDQGFPGDTNVLVTGTPPPGRNGHSATLAIDADDEENGRIIIIGGWLGVGPLAASDMHVLDVSNGGRQMRWYQPAVKGTPPGPCNMHSADYVPLKKEVFVFRGGNGREYLNDLHALDVDTFTWRQVETNGAVPQQRANHSSAMLEETGELFIFGGWNGTERLNDIHILDTATSTWTCPYIGGVLPHPRAGMTLTALRGRIYLFGGSGTSSKCFQDLQILDRKEMAWLDVTPYERNSGSRQRYERDRDHHSDNDACAPQQQSRWRPASNSYDRHNRSDNMLESTYNFTQNEGQAAVDPMSDLVPTADSAGTQNACRGDEFAPYRADWRSRDLAVHPRSADAVMASPNPNDEDTIPAIILHGRGPGRRAGHTATAMGRHIFVFGGSCGSNYLNDFFVLDTDPQPQSKVYEPTSLQLLERRLGHFHNDEEFSDVTFLVEGQKVYGHKMVLSIVSDCFRAMFTTGFRETEALEIKIPDCSYRGFTAIMEYIYSGQTPMMDVKGQDRVANISHLVEILELADRFFLDHLKQICESVLQPAINSETIDFLLPVSQKTNARQLQEVCDHFLRNQENR